MQENKESREIKENLSLFYKTQHNDANTSLYETTDTSKFDKYAKHAIYTDIQLIQEKWNSMCRALTKVFIDPKNPTAQQLEALPDPKNPTAQQLKEFFTIIFKLRKIAQNNVIFLLALQSFLKNAAGEGFTSESYESKLRLYFSKNMYNLLKSKQFIKDFLNIANICFSNMIRKTFRESGVYTDTLFQLLFDCNPEDKKEIINSDVAYNLHNCFIGTINDFMGKNTPYNSKEKTDGLTKLQMAYRLFADVRANVFSIHNVPVFDNHENVVNKQPAIPKLAKGNPKNQLLCKEAIEDVIDNIHAKRITREVIKNPKSAKHRSLLQSVWQSIKKHPFIVAAGVISAAYTATYVAVLFGLATATISGFLLSPVGWAGATIGLAISVGLGFGWAGYTAYKTIKHCCFNNKEYHHVEETTKTREHMNSLIDQPDNAIIKNRFFAEQSEARPLIYDNKAIVAAERDRITASGDNPAGIAGINSETLLGIMSQKFFCNRHHASNSTGKMLMGTGHQHPTSRAKKPKKKKRNSMVSQLHALRKRSNSTEMARQPVQEASASALPSAAL